MILILTLGILYVLMGIGLLSFTRLTCPPGTPYGTRQQILVALFWPMTLVVLGIEAFLGGFGKGLGYYYKGWTKNDDAS